MYSLYVISNRPEFFDPIVKSLSPLRVSYFNGSGYKSFSALVNACVAKSSTEIVIVMSDKVLPTKEHVEKTVKLLQSGYAFVALYRFAFFGFKKELMRRIGMMDEGYPGGGYEDDDYYIRLVENNLSMYVTHDVPYVSMPSSWNADSAREYYFKKWQYDAETETLVRMLPDTPTAYDLGPSTGEQFLPGTGFSYVPLQQVAQYFYINIKGKQ